MDQQFCRRLDNHRFVACWHHIHTPEEHPANNKDHPEIRHVSAAPDSYPAADSYYQHLGLEWHHRLLSTFPLVDQRIHDEPAAADHGDVHHNDGNTAALSTTVRSFT